jgi:hypothetical protein
MLARPQENGLLPTSVTRWIFFEDVNILIITFCVCADGFQGLSCKHFQGQNRRFRVFEANYWKEFQN